MAKGASAVLGSAFLFALLPVFLRLAYAAGANPYCLMAARTAMASLAMAALCLLTGRSLLPHRAALGPVALACTAYSAMSLCFNLACSEMEAGPVNALFHLSPIFVLTCAVAGHKQSLDRCTTCAGALAAIGCLALSASFSGGLPTSGVLLALGAAILSAAYTLAVASPKLGTVDALVLTFYVCATSCCTSLVVGAINHDTPLDLSPQALIWASLAALLSTAAAMSLFVYGTRKTGAIASSVLSNTEVIFTPLASGALLQETTGIVALMSYGVIAAACILATLPPKDRPS
ncbi:DMT family transporter [Adlercreutzia sp. R25]|uniref:DMT family transporter n=1 Tax=Adlercreutzia shanghongiae TaxID=3111773 RepID=A0ABU6IZK8_9ACTN|nr:MULTISPECIES: DMT family transporter [unclassified Adlercreutzia]MEC4272782.1 DMT family transporter [Adlercreutzia sp. R25]MEC4295100.1 DMT family transporter [Adlercreutzia sp. R22]